jgi:hypothetical protein
MTRLRQAKFYFVTPATKGVCSFLHYFVRKHLIFELFLTLKMNKKESVACGTIHRLKLAREQKKSRHHCHSPS